MCPQTWFYYPQSDDFSPEMSAAEENINNQVTDEDKSEVQTAQGTDAQGEISIEPPQSVDQNGGDIAAGDSTQAAELGKGDEGEKVERDEQDQKEEVSDAKDDTENPSTVEQKDENPSEVKQTTPPVEGEDSKAEETTMSVVISEPDKDVKTQEANAQTEGRESPVGKDADSPAGSPAKVVESQSESESPLVAPPTSKAEKSIDSEALAGDQAVGIAKDGFTANGK